MEYGRYGNSPLSRWGNSPGRFIIGQVPKVKEIESRLERTEQQLRLFQKISRLMVREMSLQEVLQGIVSLIVEFMECDSCLVYLIQDSDRKSTRLNSSHQIISYAVFCLKKKKDHQKSSASRR